MENKYIKDLTLVSAGRTLFDIGAERYVVPLYQRAFTWGTEKYSNRENEIIQLIDDIMDLKSGDQYYLGTLIVFYRAEQNAYEVIDGQQRLTALYLLFKCLGYTIEKTSALTYDCRPKSDYALNKIEALMNDASTFDSEYDNGIYLGIKTVQQKIGLGIKNNSLYADELKHAMEHVHLFRIEVPKCTDLNRYFEIMNTRGEQLEQQDVVKASLMSYLDSSERGIFAEVWNACSDMTGYVQMHFNPEHRQKIFGPRWNETPTEDRVRSAKNADFTANGRLKIQDVIKEDFKIELPDRDTDNDERIRFESIIDFRYFLLHVLKVFVTSEQIVSANAEDKLMDDLLDDKKLIRTFMRVIENGMVNGEKIPKRDFAWKFIIYLLRCRFLFDKYIIKREYRTENSEGEWSLQELRTQDRKAYYAQTPFRDYYEREATAEHRNNYNKMIQACLRVSYTSPKIMHWITELLQWVFANSETGLKNPSQYDRFAQKIAARVAFAVVYQEELQLGINTPHIVLNFLDFLLWKQSYDLGCNEKFDFEFRNSVEHWYPQHPTENRDGCPPWDESNGNGTVDRFGNLALLPSNINSRFSNQSPLGKKGYESVIANGSLKLREMAALTKSSELWRTQDCERHENEMLDLLKKSCADLSGGQLQDNTCPTDNEVTSYC